jgi:hypothetical protein
MPVPDAAIVGLRFRQAEFGLVQKQTRWLFRLETTGLEGLAAMMGALAATSGVGRENAALPAAAGKRQFAEQHSGLVGSRRSTWEAARGLLWRQLMKDGRVRSNHLSSVVMVFRQHRNAPW